ncbi:hypothetical protein AB0E88_19020 [Streptomyces sp. NPDC028635]|uniref:hypothetical protein n=1 Tax=Streptomyces sp. NPDC028635 TaxID=3154800 RepID=UPI0033E07737
MHALGLRFRLHRKVAPRCTADFVLPRYSVAVFVDGCFWHGCPSRGTRHFRGPNALRWEAKDHDQHGKGRQEHRSSERRRMDRSAHLGV